MSGLNVEVIAHQLGGTPLIRDFFDAAPALAPFFAGLPWDPASLDRVSENVRASFNTETRRAMVDAIQPTTDAARAKLEAIANGEGFFVSTGQQAGLFSGPLFTIYKTLTAIRVADAFEARLGVPVAPLFWVAADDHDFAEVNHTYVIGADNELRRVEINGGGDVQRSMHRHVLDDSATAAVDQLATLLPASEFSEELLAALRAAYQPGNTVAGAFQQLIEHVFARYDMLVTSSAHPVVKTLAVPVILRELERSEAHEKLVRAQTDKLLAAGYHEQVGVREGAANVLYEDDNGRDRLTRVEDGWQLSRSKRRFSDDELRTALTAQPESFSPNVLLRPVVASAVFPTLAYVGGPAEVGYFAQIGCLFAGHRVPAPLAWPRASFDVVEYKVRKVLDKFALEASTFRQPFDQLVSQIMRDDLPDSIVGALALLNEQIASGYAALVDATQAIDPTLRGPLENARNSSHKALNDVEKKIVSHLKKKNEVGIEQLRKASANLFPNGAPQERVISGISYLARYGPAFMDALLAEISIELSASAPEWRGTKC